MSKIIEDGAADKVFRVAYPAETATFLLLATGEIFHDPETVGDPEKAERLRITVEQCLARALGIKEGSFRMDF